MNISLVKQKKIRSRILDSIPEIIEARKIKEEIAEFLVKTAKDSLSEEELYLYENFSIILNIMGSSDRLKISGENICSDPINCVYYYDYSNEYKKNEVYREVLFSPDYSKTNKNDNIFQGCPELYKSDCSEVLDLITNDKEREEFKKKVSTFINLIKTAEKKMYKLSIILGAKEINLKDIKKYSPKLYNVIKIIEES